MADPVDWYELLGIREDATERDIRRAYRREALKYHPDKNDSPQARGRFHLLTRAVEVLLDPQARQELGSRTRSAGARKPTNDAKVDKLREELLKSEAKSSQRPRGPPSEIWTVSRLQLEGYKLRQELDAKIQNANQNEGFRTVKVFVAPGQEGQLPPRDSPAMERMLQIGNKVLLVFSTIDGAREFADANVELRAEFTGSWIPPASADFQDYLSYTKRRVHRRRPSSM